MQSRWLLGGLLAFTFACPPAPQVNPTPEVCNDNVDNDLDERIDCADTDCAGDSALCPNFEVCNDGIDNDVDGFVDCGDSGCVGEPICNEGQNCTDQDDNDGDGLTDCEDSECAAHPACGPETNCQDGVDNDQDGFADCRDPGCNTTCPTFSLTVSTELNGANGLVLHTNLPARTEDCLAFPAVNTPCQDNDQDGLSDAWENIVLDRFRPVRRLDEDESLVNDPESILGDVGRVALALSSTPGAPFRAHIMIMLGYAKDYGSCGGFTSHNGDSERVAVNVEQINGTLGDVQAVQYFTTGHEGTANDQSQIFNVQDFGELVYTTTLDAGQPRWVVFPSADKHATYATAAICEGVSFIPCLDEDCGPDGVANPALFDALPDFVNAGEDNARLVTSLSQLGFPGDDAWADQDFCGGLDRSGGCSSAVREKLVNDPFGAF